MKFYKMGADCKHTGFFVDPNFIFVDPNFSTQSAKNTPDGKEILYSIYPLQWKLTILLT